MPQGGLDKAAGNADGLEIASRRPQVGPKLPPDGSKRPQDDPSGRAGCAPNQLYTCGQRYTIESPLTENSSEPRHFSEEVSAWLPATLKVLFSLRRRSHFAQLGPFWVFSYSPFLVCSSSSSSSSRSSSSNNSHLPGPSAVTATEQDQEPQEVKSRARQREEGRLWRWKPRRPGHQGRGNALRHEPDHAEQFPERGGPESSPTAEDSQAARQISVQALPQEPNGAALKPHSCRRDPRNAGTLWQGERSRLRP